MPYWKKEEKNKNYKPTSIIWNPSKSIDQIKELPYPAELGGYIARVEYLLQLYPKKDVRQIHIIYGAIEGTVVDAAKAFI